MDYGLGLIVDLLLEGLVLEDLLVKLGEGRVLVRHLRVGVGVLLTIQGSGVRNSEVDPQPPTALVRIVYTSKGFNGVRTQGSGFGS